MKTLDEVIDDFEKACDLERRCANCSGCLGQEYGCPNDGAESVPDALHYLKEYRKLDSLDAVAFSEDDSQPLTWDELKSMQGKPVWVEADDGKYKRWFIVGNFFSWFEKEDFDAHVNLYSSDGAMEMSKETFGSYWQAYREERE